MGEEEKTGGSPGGAAAPSRKLGKRGTPVRPPRTGPLDEPAQFSGDPPTLDADGKAPFASWAQYKSHVPPPLGGLSVRVTTPDGQVIQSENFGRPSSLAKVPPAPWKRPDYRVIQCQLRHPVSGRKVPLNYPVTEAEYDAAAVRAYNVKIGWGLKPKAGE